jgi:tetratricopeptide (TPR) repeat protein
MTLIQRSAIQPGGGHFQLAVQKLNHYFEGTSPSEYELESAPREYLTSELPPKMVTALQNRNWSLRDTRHIEDCMMYYGIANRVAGTGEDFDRVRRVFEWVVRQIQLVPAGSLRTAQFPQAYARPYDVLLRGMATEAEGVWAERAWLFIALCRQLNIDAGLITYTKTSSLEPRLPRIGTNFEVEATLYGLRVGPKTPVVWICTALIGGKAYLFDTRLGLEVPGPGGVGVATLEDALADAAILERMNLPGYSPYGTSRASLLASRTKIGILMDSWQGYFSPKMKMLQRELAGKNRSILYHDPADERDQFVKVLGDRAGAISLWRLPMEVESRLFGDGQFVAAIQSSLFLFRPEFPLLYARIKQLRGELDEAIEDYGKLRFAEDALSVIDKKTPIPKSVQDALDVYATYYLAQTHLERNNLVLAELEFKNMLELAPEPGPSQPYYNMLRWGANANLGRIYESKNDTSRAIAYQTQADPTTQYIGNLLRARELVFRDPMAAAVTLPPPPPPKPILQRPAAPASTPRAATKTGP